MFIVGFNERRGKKIYGTAMVVENGKIIGTYSKAFPCSEHETPGRRFPVFKKDGIAFGVVICADGGYIEPTRILAMKGGRIIFAPRYNYIQKEHLIGHFQKVRSDHIARAVENSIWFMRCNNVVFGQDTGLGYEGVGYGDSYLVDPGGEIVVRSRRDTECFITADIVPREKDGFLWRSLKSARELGPILSRAVRTCPGHEALSKAK